MPSSFALNRSEANRFIPEGEYNVRTGKKIQRSPSSKKTKKKSVTHKKSKSLPTRKKGMKITKTLKNKSHHATDRKKHSAKHSARKPKLPLVRETKLERDMPFVSIPNRRVKRVDHTIVMDDPGFKKPNKRLQRKTVDAPVLEIERAPAADKASEISLQQIQDSAQSEETRVREPDAFDLHSGSDPMRESATTH